MIPAQFAGLESQLLIWLLAMVRPGAALLAAPIFGAPAVPVQIRLVAGFAIAVPAATMVQPAMPPGGMLTLAGFGLIASEAVIGLALGFVVQIAFAAVIVGGEALSNAMGLGFAAMIDPANGSSSPAVGQYLSILATFLFLAMDGHLVFAATIMDSFRSLPPGAGLLESPRIWNVATAGSLAFAGGVAIALPVGFAMVLIQIVMGVITRSTPSLNLFAIGVPVTVLAGVLLLALATPAMAETIALVLTEGLERAASIVRG